MILDRYSERVSYRKLVSKLLIVIKITTKIKAYQFK